MRIPRRTFIRGGAGALAAVLTGCRTETLIAPHVTLGLPRLSARPSAYPFIRLESGMHDLTVGGARVLAYLPRSARSRGRVPVLVFMHGASRDPLPFIAAHRPYADEAGVMVVAPYSVGFNWDAVNGGFGDDIPALDVIMQWVFYQVPADPRAIALSGFSDGAGYALSVGRANGDLFRRLVAYAPHSLYPVVAVERPPVIIYHGTHDGIVPFGLSSEYIVPTLREDGYDVELVSFEGGHAVPLAAIEEVVIDLRARAG